jgi:hypothetical protein
VVSLLSQNSAISERSGTAVKGLTLAPRDAMTPMVGQCGRNQAAREAVQRIEP